MDVTVAKDIPSLTRQTPDSGPAMDIYGYDGA